MWRYDELYHYGVKGMKWGVRRSQEELDRLAGRAYKVVFFKSLKDQGYDAVEDLEDSFSHRINPLIIFERENSLKVTKVSELPEPSFDSEEWNKIVKEAEEARKSTEEYHKKVGIK